MLLAEGCAPWLLLGGPSSHPPGVGPETRHPRLPGPPENSAQYEPMCGVDRDVRLSPEAGPGAAGRPQPGTEVTARDALCHHLQLGDGQWVLAVIFLTLKLLFTQETCHLYEATYSPSFPLPRCPRMNLTMKFSRLPHPRSQFPFFLFLFLKNTSIDYREEGREG